MKNFKSVYLLLVIIFFICTLGSVQSFKSYQEASFYSKGITIIDIKDFKSPSGGIENIQYISAKALFTVIEKQNEQLEENSILGLILFPFIFSLSFIIALMVERNEKTVQ